MSAGFGKKLAHTDKKVRDQAVKSLIGWLKNNGDTLSHLELLKLWRGLFYCFWMSDKPTIQQHLADRLALVIYELDDSLSIKYLEAFWTTIISQWYGIDRLRLDKFYNLLRRFQFYSFTFLKAKEWDDSLVGSYLDVLEKGPLSPSESHVPDSLRVHAVEAYFEELNKAVGHDIPQDTLITMMRPIVNLLSSTTEPITLSKLRVIFKKIRRSAPAEENSETNDDHSEDDGTWKLPFDLHYVARMLVDLSESSGGKKRKTVLSFLYQAVPREIAEAAQKHLLPRPDKLKLRDKPPNRYLMRKRKFLSMEEILQRKKRAKLEAAAQSEETPALTRFDQPETVATSEASNERAVASTVGDQSPTPAQPRSADVPTETPKRSATDDITREGLSLCVFLNCK
ncbi:nucleolar protein,Nop52-domain-containing protein [Zopfochytrium polystomum]|nr:nucleolar protein,Nop52-domain-containing protein [Zopfochytrium polystomum]